MGNVKRHSMYMSVGDLKKAIEGLTDDAPVLYQRIEDVYFDKHGWEGSSTYMPDGDCPNGVAQYIQVFGPVRYKDEDALFLTAHY